MEKSQIAIRLIHNGVQPGIPLDEPMRFGVQDTKGGVTQVLPSRVRHAISISLSMSEGTKQVRPFSAARSLTGHLQAASFI